MAVKFDEFNQFAEDMEIIQKLGDNPNADNGISGDGMKLKFDEGGLKVKSFLNTMIAQLNGFVEKLNNLIGSANNIFSGGIMLGPLDMSGNTISGLNAPTEDDEAATKGFVDAAKEETQTFTKGFVDAAKEETQTFTKGLVDAAKEETQTFTKGFVDAAKEETQTFTNTQITDRVIYGKGKNLLKNTAKSQTINGVTFTVNEDGSVTVYGTATAVTYFKMNTTLNAGAYILSSKVPETGKMLHLSVAINKKWAANEYGNGANFECTETSEVLVEIAVKQGYTADCTAYPMIRLASETDDTYEPYYEGLMEVHDKLSMELLWENPSPTSEFARNTIDLDLSQYSFLRILFKANKDAIYYSVHDMAANNTEHVFLDVDNDNNDGALLTRSAIADNSTNKLTIYYAYFHGSYKTLTKNNNYMIPVAIYGIKGVSA